MFEFFKSVLPFVKERVFLLLIPKTALWFSLKFDSLLFNVYVSMKYVDGPGETGRFNYSKWISPIIKTYFIDYNYEYSIEFEEQVWHFQGLDVWKLWTYSKCCNSLAQELN